MASFYYSRWSEPLEIITPGPAQRAMEGYAYLNVLAAVEQFSWVLMEDSARMTVRLGGGHDLVVLTGTLRTKVGTLRTKRT